MKIFLAILSLIVLSIAFIIICNGKDFYSVMVLNQSDDSIIVRCSLVDSRGKEDVEVISDEARTVLTKHQKKLGLFQNLARVDGCRYSIGISKEGHEEVSTKVILDSSTMDLLDKGKLCLLITEKNIRLKLEVAPMSLANSLGGR